MTRTPETHFYSTDEGRGRADGIVRMAAQTVVADTPYMAMTAPDGAFAFKGGRARYYHR